VRVRLPLLCAANESRATYSIREPETISLRVPAAALLSDLSIDARGALVINASAGTLELGGSLAPNASEAALVEPAPGTLRLALRSDTWEGRIGQSGFAPTVELLAGLSALAGPHAQPAGWAAVVQPGLSSSGVRRLDDATLELTLPQFAA